MIACRKSGLAVIFFVLAVVIAFIIALSAPVSGWADENDGVLAKIAIHWMSRGDTCGVLSLITTREGFSVSEFEKTFANAQDRGNHCAAADASFQLMQYHLSPSPDQSLTWGERSIAELFAAHDFRNSVVYGIRSLHALDIPLQDERAIPIRLLILRSIYEAAIAVGTDRDPQWMQLAFGSNRMVEFHAFVEDFPNDPNVALVNHLAQALAGQMLERELRLAENYRRQGDILAALIELEGVYPHREPYLVKAPQFGEVLSRVIQTQTELADFLIKHPNQKRWPRENLDEQFGLPVTDGPNEIAAFLRDRAGKLRLYLVQFLQK